LERRCRKKSVPGLITTKTLQTDPSISTGNIMSGLSGGLNDEWTSVSSKSKTNVFLPEEWGF
jgi:hypothetical protein